MTSTSQNYKFMSKVPSEPNIQFRSWFWVPWPQTGKKMPLFFCKLAEKVGADTYNKVLIYQVLLWPKGSEMVFLSIQPIISTKLTFLISG